MSPVGETFGVDVYAPTHKPVLVGQYTVDAVSGWRGYRRFDYTDAAHLPGRFLGFELVTTEHLVQDRYDLLELDVPPGITSQSWLVYGELETEYDLSVLHQEVVRERMSTDWNHAWMEGGAPLLTPQWEVQRSYTSSSPAPDSWFDRRWPDNVETDLYNTSGPQGYSTTWSTDTEYDTHGNVLQQTHSDGVEVHTTWVSDATKALHRPSSSETWSPDPDTGLPELVERATFEYDGSPTAVTRGQLTKQVVCAGEVGALCSDSLVWQFTRTLRGAVSAVDGPLERDVSYSNPSFGESIWLTETQPLGHVSSKTIDAMGRLTSSTDVNGVVRTSVYDSLGRGKEQWLQGQGASVGYQLSSTTYQDATVPRWTAEVSYQYDATGVLVDQAEARTVSDGFGRPVQTWKEGVAGWVVQETEQDVRGATRRTSEPHVEALPPVFPPQLSSSRGLTRGWTRVDAVGETLWSWDADTGDTHVDHPAPLTTRTVLEDGYERQEVVDPLGRLTEVWQGFAGAPVQVATYTWDGRDRVQQFEDGAGNGYRYGFDGAGRVRTVERRPDPADAWETWYRFDWEGPNPHHQYEGLSATASVTWAYDDLGRTVSKEVTDPLLGGLLVFGWVWDGQWKGARDEVTDERGSTTYVYGATGVYGRLGHVTQTKRTTTAATPQLQQVVGALTMTHDLQGRVLSTSWPSGSVVTSAYAPSGEVTTQVLTPPPGPTPTTTVTYTYDPSMGLSDGWVLQQGTGNPWWSSQDHRSSSTQLVGRTWKQTSGAGVVLADRALQLEWTTGGRLSWKLFDAEPISYTYDHLGRIERVVDGSPSSGVNFEKYTRDVAGNPTSMRQRLSTGGQWSWNYGTTTAYNEVPWRDRPQGAGTVLETFGYDDQSRLTQWDTTGAPAFAAQRAFSYDGAGRLRQVVKTGVGATTEKYAYDVDDNIPYEVRAVGASETHVFRHAGWERRATSAGTWVDTEQVLPMASLRGGELVVVLQGVDGQALQTRGPTTASQELLGAFGLRLSKYNVTTDNWVVHGYHGEEVNRTADVVHKGARHLALRDGMWLQPDGQGPPRGGPASRGESRTGAPVRTVRPLLYLGLTRGDLRNPVGYSGVYAAGDSNAFVDRSGRWFEPTTPVDAYSAGNGWASAAMSAWNGDIVGMVVDANFAAMDTVSAMAPVFGGTSVATLGAKAGVKASVKAAVTEAVDAAADLVRSAADDVLGASKGAKEVTISRGRYPETAGHVEEAQAAGKSTTLTIDRGGAAGRRRESLGGTDPVPGMNRDEYPPAMFKEGGQGASVKPISPSDNRGAGSCMGHQCRGLPDGSQVEIKVTD
jgi:YD repeat-containing protein